MTRAGPVDPSLSGMTVIIPVNAQVDLAIVGRLLEDLQPWMALDAGREGTVFEWDSATERFSKLAEHPFEAWDIAQNRFVASGGAFYAAARLKESSDSGIYRSEDGISWAPMVELELTKLEVLNLEGDTLYAAATHPPDVQIYSLDLCER